MIAVEIRLRFSFFKEFLGAGHAAGCGPYDDSVGNYLPAGEGLPRGGKRYAVRPRDIIGLLKPGDFAGRQQVSRRSRKQAERFYSRTIFFQ